MMLAQATSSWTIFEAAHLLNRAGYGGSPRAVRAFHELGREGAVASLLEPKEGPAAFPSPEWTAPEVAERNYKERIASQRELQRSLRTMEPEAADRARRLGRQKYQQESRRQMVEAQGWWFRRMARTEAPLVERMTLFWHDHFATSAQKVRDPVLIFRQNELFRRHALGNFKELATAIVMDPAMMLYLDTQNSRKGRPNENFAREVMELFTLGEGNYSEDDIREAAKAFTGYQIDRATGRVTHNRRQWDDSEKTVFGETGEFDGRQVMEVLFKQDAAARMLPKKLWEHFVAENPSEELVDGLAARFASHDFQVGPLLREIFLAEEFYAEPVMRSQIKSPIQYLVQLLKQLEVETPPPGFPVTGQQQLGQVLFMPPNVAGWDSGKAWINTNTLLARYNLAGLLTKGAEGAAGMMGEEGRRRAGGAMGMQGGNRRNQRAWRGPDYKRIAPADLRENPADLVDSLCFRFFQGPVPQKHRESFIQYAEAKLPAGITDKEIGELCHLMLSTPIYQLC
jgi:uncharacterized protein (DUF1800 family)